MPRTPRKKNPYEYFSVSADILMIRRRRSRFEILLIRRKNPPYQNHWALPGGFVDRDEDTLTAAHRELLEETGLRVKKLTEFGSFSDPDRDPRGRVVTISYYGFASAGSDKAMAGDDAGELSWFPAKQLPKLAFDHREMIEKGLRAALPRPKRL